jgi:hypothetical protein
MILGNFSSFNCSRALASSGTARKIELGGPVAEQAVDEARGELE